MDQRFQGVCSGVGYTNRGHALDGFRDRLLVRLDAGSCNGCELKIHALNNACYDLERFGIHFAATPRRRAALYRTSDENYARGAGMDLQRTSRSEMGHRGRRTLLTGLVRRQLCRCRWRTGSRARESAYSRLCAWAGATSHLLACAS